MVFDSAAFGETAGFSVEFGAPIIFALQQPVQTK